jgi:two-component system copper resistance phosphate regulon response regulator CusR
LRLLLVEDDVEIAAQVAGALRAEGYGVDVRHEGSGAVDAAIVGSYGLLILDVMMPGMDGWEVCREVRRSGLTLPILMLTARDSVDDRVRGLEDGADDYLTKPFDARELLARVRALLRREQAMKTGVIQIQDLVIDSRAKRVTRGGQEIHLTPREYTLLEALARNVGRTLTREVILESVWDSEDHTENAVNFHVTSLRKKVDAGRETKLIHTVHGFGYVLRSGEEKQV